MTDKAITKVIRSHGTTTIEIYKRNNNYKFDKLDKVFEIEKFGAKELIEELKNGYLRDRIEEGELFEDEVYTYLCELFNKSEKPYLWKISCVSDHDDNGGINDEFHIEHRDAVYEVESNAQFLI